MSLEGETMGVSAAPIVAVDLDQGEER